MALAVAGNCSTRAGRTIRRTAYPDHRLGSLAGARSDLPATIDATKLAADYQRVAMNSYFLLQRSARAPASRPAGSVSFAAGIAGAGAERCGGDAASLENAKLLVNFSTSQFATQFDLLTQGQRFARQAEGNVFADGSFGNYSQFGNNMIVQGTLANGATLDAAYLFQSRLDDNRVAYGATRWKQ